MKVRWQVTALTPATSEVSRFLNLVQQATVTRYRTMNKRQTSG
ncbi:hypothetical protein ACVWWO_008681 [Bradyrhizobium sp. F1.13.1]